MRFEEHCFTTVVADTEVLLADKLFNKEVTVESQVANETHMASMDSTSHTGKQQSLFTM